MSAAPQSASAPAVLVDRLEKSFPRRRPIRELVRRPFSRRERVRALSGVSFTVGAGELVGLLGPNGAGKTTLLKILCGLVLPDRGRAQVFGTPVGVTGLSRVLGLVHGDERSFYWRLTARENLEFFARLHHLPRRLRARQVGELLDKVNLSADADRRFSDFSSGMRQRLAIARALLADPPVLLMDEPTRSLDPVRAGEQREWIKAELHERLGKTILMATHNLREAEVLCDRVVVIVDGAVRADETPGKLRRWGFGGLHVRLRVGGPRPAHFVSAEVLEEQVEGDARELLVRLPADDALDALLREVHAAGGRVLNCAPETRDLETVFRRLVEESATAEGR